MRSILQDHNRRYPFWSVQDLYKLVHQSAMGSEHAVGDQAGAEAWLSHELAELGPGQVEPLIDPISKDGQVVRIHLRPYIDQDRDPKLLLEAFVLTSQEFKGSPTRIDTCWEAACILSQGGLLPFALEELDRFFIEMEARDFPAVHHSPAFEQYYRPAYRVVARRFMPKGFA